MGSSFSSGVTTGYSSLAGNVNQAEILNLKSFRFSVLKSATQNFSLESKLVGESHFGSLFKGWINERSLKAAKPGTGIAIAVRTYSGDDTNEEFLEKIRSLWQLNHQNLLRLIGYCIENGNRLLVYEFMLRGSLDDHLYKRSDVEFEPLSWNLRIKVVVGVAKGLAYLLGSQANVRYYHLMPCNILIDSDYNAKLSDFTLVKEGQATNLYESRLMRVDINVAPEYAHTGCWTTRSEIYGVGMVLLQLLTGRQRIDLNRPRREEISLIEFVKPFLSSKQKILQIMDPAIEGQYSYSVAIRAALLARKCLMDDPTQRPNVEELVKELEEIRELQNAFQNSTKR